ncbi:zinc metallochaperone AztD [Chelativorans sp. M5D2P16]|uniref:zinc metallochaperone AztD n=1 Tax=Chelativorans sp. M5D2P16 TaxID=3095678 RepID=UPI002ACAD402|nr:zinc metallochaperone AztD [Chelativorans sp. M5D2P16]MDZ5697287.1 zinc metallochaperone AztD [Chelativorans sp. M5D2P16]
MRKNRGALSGIGLAAVLALGPAQAADGAENVWRLFVADRNEPVMHVLDAASGETIESFTLESQGRLYASESGETVFAVQADGNVAAAFSTGIAEDDHGDHADLDVTAPKALDAKIAGEKPVHFVAHHGEIAIFFDGEGVARVVREAELAAGGMQQRLVETADPHHGIAIPMGAYTIVSVPDGEDPSRLPVGVRVLDADGQPVGEIAECPGLHGEAASGRVVAIACDTGLLIVRAPGGTPEIDHLAYDASLPEDAKVSTLVGGRGLQYFLGNFGSSAVVLIDPEDETPFRLIELPLRRVHFAVDPVQAKFAYALTEDGRLHQIDVLAGEIVKSAAVTEPYSMDGHWNDPRPRIAVAGDEVIVTDPLNGVLHALDTRSLEETREIPLAGAPYEIVAVGGSGAVHD